MIKKTMKYQMENKSNGGETGMRGGLDRLYWGGWQMLEVSRAITIQEILPCCQTRNVPHALFSTLMAAIV